MSRIIINIMKKETIEALVALPIILMIGFLLALAGGSSGLKTAGVPVYAWCVLLAFMIQWLAFVPAYLSQSEKYYDLTGSFTYLSVLLFALSLSSARDPRSLLLAVLIAVWAMRLGSFLFLRIRAVGEDSRFRDIKPSFIRFLMTWSLQGLWVCFSLAAALAAITAQTKINLDLWALSGALVWIFGFVIEALADQQKNQFRKQKNKPLPFIHTGLWSWSRHPNYFGEIVLWMGIAMIAYPVLQGWQLFTLISPVFITVLLTRISGVPMLEDAADKKWGGQSEYEAYKARTSVLVLWPPKN